MGETEAKVDQAIVASKDNAVAIESVSAQVGENTAVTEHIQVQAASTHELVNGHMKEWREALEKVAALQAQVAVLTGNAAGRETGRQIAIDLLATNAQAPEQQTPAIQPDGTVVITAPAVIAVKVPDVESPPAPVTEPKP